MATWKSYALKYTEGVIKNPSAVAFSVILSAFIAGSKSEHIRDNTAKQLSTVTAVLGLFVACWMGYFLARAIRQLRDDRRPNP